MDKFGSWLLNPNVIKDQYQYLRLHGVEAEDNFFYVDATSHESSFYQLGKQLASE